MSRTAVLIFSADPLASALLGASVELSGYAPHFPRHNETARAALLRVRPRLALVDCDHEEACSEEWIGPALMTDAQVFLFHSRRTVRDMSEFANRLSLRVIDMPTEHDALTQLLKDALSD